MARLRYILVKVPSFAPVALTWSSFQSQLLNHLGSLWASLSWQNSPKQSVSRMCGMESYFSVILVPTTAAGAALDFFTGWAVSKEFLIGTRGFQAVVIATKLRPQWALEIELISIRGAIELQWGIASVVPEKPDESPICIVTRIVGSIGPPRLDGVAVGVMVDVVLDSLPVDMFALGSMVIWGSNGKDWETAEVLEIGGYWTCLMGPWVEDCTSPTVSSAMYSSGMHVSYMYTAQMITVTEEAESHSKVPCNTDSDSWQVSDDPVG